MTMRRRQTLDQSTTDRLLAGRMGTEDAPPTYRRTAGLLQAAATPVPGEGIESDTIAAMLAAVRDEAAAAETLSPRRSTMPSKRVVGRTVAVALAAVTLSAGAAGAATGHLPDPIQDTVSKAAEHAGLDLPRGHKPEKADKADGGVERVTNETDPACALADDGSFARNRGQYLKQERARGPEALAAAEASACGMPVNSQTPGEDGSDDESGTTPEQGQSEDKSKSEDKGQAGEHGKPAEEGQDDESQGDDDAPAESPAKVETPNDGGVDTGTSASDGKNDAGADKAGERSQSEKKADE